MRWINRIIDAFRQTASIPGIRLTIWYGWIVEKSGGELTVSNHTSTARESRGLYVMFARSNAARTTGKLTFPPVARINPLKSTAFSEKNAETAANGR
jgi:hypothetical protein